MVIQNFMTLRKGGVTKSSSRAECHNDLCVAAVSEQDRAIGQNVERIRLSRKLSKRELARKAGIHYNTVDNVEKGKGANSKTLQALADALGVALDDLVAMPVTDGPSRPVVERFLTSWWCSKLEREEGQALTPAEERHLRSIDLAQYLGSAEPSDKAIYFYVLARRESRTKGPA